MISASSAYRAIKKIHSIAKNVSLVASVKSKILTIVINAGAASLKISLSTVKLAYHVFKLNTKTGI